MLYQKIYFRLDAPITKNKVMPLLEMQFWHDFLTPTIIKCNF